MNKTKSKSNNKIIINRIKFLQRIPKQLETAIQHFIPISAFYPHFSVLSPISVFYPHFSVLSPFQCFIPISVFYPHFSVLSPFQCFILISVFYPHFSVLSPFQCFIPISAFYPQFSVLSPFQFPFSVFVLAFYPDPPDQWRRQEGARGGSALQMS